MASFPATQLAVLGRDWGRVADKMRNCLPATCVMTVHQARSSGSGSGNRAAWALQASTGFLRSEQSHAQLPSC